MRLAAALAAAVIAGPLPALAQTADGRSACIVGDGDWIAEVCLAKPHAAPEYDHSVLGDTPEWTALTITYGAKARLALGESQVSAEIPAGAGHIFEDVIPRLSDLDADGQAEIIVVQSAFQSGARLLAYAITPEPRLLAATPYIGQRHRWLAPAGIADFNGDGRVEIAFVDRPHLRRELVFVQLEGSQLVETLRLRGLTNHRIGEDFISGGVRNCGMGPELILASKDWTRLMQVRGGQVSDLGPMPPGGAAIPPC